MRTGPAPGPDRDRGRLQRRGPLRCAAQRPGGCAPVDAVGPQQRLSPSHPGIRRLPRQPDGIQVVAARSQQRGASGEPGHGPVRRDTSSQTHRAGPGTRVRQQAVHGDRRGNGTIRRRRREFSFQLLDLRLSAPRSARARAAKGSSHSAMVTPSAPARITRRHTPSACRAWPEARSTSACTVSSPKCGKWCSTSSSTRAQCCRASWALPVSAARRAATTRIPSSANGPGSAPSTYLTISRVIGRSPTSSDVRATSWDSVATHACGAPMATRSARAGRGGRGRRGDVRRPCGVSRMPTQNVMAQ